MGRPRNPGKSLWGEANQRLVAVSEDTVTRKVRSLETLTGGVPVERSGGREAEKPYKQRFAGEESRATR